MRRIPLIVLLGLMVCFTPSVAEALRCGSRVVERGALDLQVLARCGEPFWRVERSEWAITGSGGPIERRVERRFEDWYYNFGPSRLMLRLRFADGVLQSEESLGYGAASVGGRCNAQAMARGTSEGELVLRCGPPQHRRVTYADEVTRDDFGRVWVQPRTREEWVLRRDDSRFLARVVLVDGRVETVEALR